MGIFSSIAGRITGIFRPRSSDRRDMEEVGVPGTIITGGYIQSNETQSSLSGVNKFTTYANTLMNVTIVAAGVRHYGALVGGVAWKFQPADESDRAKLLTEQLEEILEDMCDPWARVIRRQSMYKFNGFNIQEKQSKKMTRKKLVGLIGLEAIEQRPASTIEQWDVEKSKIYGVVQRDPLTGQAIYLERDKLFYNVDDTISDSPEGVGLLRHVVEPARQLARYEQLEGFGFETDLRGVPIGRAPIALLAKMVKDKTISREEAVAQLNGMKNFITKHIKSPELGILVDSSPWTDSGESGTPISLRQWDLELMKTDSGAQEPVHVVIERKNREIARVLGVEHLLLGGGSTNASQALSKDKTQAFSALIQSAVDEIAKQVDKDIVPWIWEKNGWPEELMPKSVPDAVRLRDVEEVIDTLVKLSQAGAPPIDAGAVNQVRGMISVVNVPQSAFDQRDEQAAVALEATRAKAQAPGNAPPGGGSNTTAKPRGGGAGAPPGSGSGGAPGGVPRAPKPDTAKSAEPTFLNTPPGEL